MMMFHYFASIRKFVSLKVFNVRYVYRPLADAALNKYERVFALAVSVVVSKWFLLFLQVFAEVLP